MAWKSSFRQNYRTTFSPTVPPSAARISRFVTTWRHVVAKVGTSKRGGKQWQTTPKNLPRMQRTGTIPVAWLSSGLCPDRPKGWIPIIIILKINKCCMNHVNKLVLSVARIHSCASLCPTFLENQTPLHSFSINPSVPGILLGLLHPWRWDR